MIEEQNRQRVSPLQQPVRPPIEDLKAFAGAACIDIFDDYDESEITSKPPRIKRAWDIGRQLRESA